MRKPDLTALVARFEEFLGCPPEPAGPAPYARVTGTDGRETPAYDLVRVLRGWGMPESALSLEPSATPVRLGDAPGGR
ncbi:hypothetical protein [Streptomyces sp. NPDC093260]|uniref:hypothetical protein n=1 Tax=Streptomyces sp. NPDC093260 TaxID=3155073 RepID=UPI003432B85B